MALKDWQKLSNTTMFQKNSIYRWRNKTNSWCDIEIIKEFDHYSVIISCDASATKREYFKTKSEALAYAKSYMRTH